MIVTKIEKKVKSDKDKVIKYQILTHCFFNEINVSNSDLDLLLELTKNNGVEVNTLCELLSDKKIFKTKQSARNAITKAEKKLLILKDGDLRKKKIWISKDLNIQTNNAVLLDMKVLGL